jgi:hypothetical protein
VHRCAQVLEKIKTAETRKRRNEEKKVARVVVFAKLSVGVVHSPLLVS